MGLYVYISALSGPSLSLGPECNGRRASPPGGPEGPGVRGRASSRLLARQIEELRAQSNEGFLVQRLREDVGDVVLRRDVLDAENGVDLRM